MSDRPDETTPVEELRRQRKGYSPGSPPYEDAGFELQRRQLEDIERRVSKPHWSMWVAIFFSAVAAIASVIALFR